MKSIGFKEGLKRDLRHFLARRSIDEMSSFKKEIEGAISEAGKMDIAYVNVKQEKDVNQLFENTLKWALGYLEKKQE